MFERECKRVAEHERPVDWAGVSKIETNFGVSVCQHTQREPCMGLVKDKALLTQHRAQNTLAQL